MEPDAMKHFLLKQFNLLMAKVDGPVGDVDVDRALTDLLSCVARETGRFIGCQEDQPQSMLGLFILDVTLGVFDGMNEVACAAEKLDGCK